MRSLTLLLISSSVFAAEVVTISETRNSKEIQVYMTDEALFTAGEKQFMAHGCRFRATTNLTTNLKENILPEACRGEITKFLLNNGYKAIDAHARTFSK